jgi:hypothetical protein
MHEARGARAVSVNFRKFSLCIARAAHAWVWQFSLPPGRWEPLAFDENQLLIFWASNGHIKRAGSLYNSIPIRNKKSKVDFPSKSKIPNVRDFLAAKCTVQQYTTKGGVSRQPMLHQLHADASSITHQLYLRLLNRRHAGFSQNVTISGYRG